MGGPKVPQYTHPNGKLQELPPHEGQEEASKQGGGDCHSESWPKIPCAHKGTDMCSFSDSDDSNANETTRQLRTPGLQNRILLVHNHSN
jgi:hypothetical protein